MTIEQAYAQLVYAVRIAVDGVIVYSRDLRYMEDDGRTESPDNININSHTATFQTDGKPIAIAVDGHKTSSVFYRNITVSSSVPFLMASYCTINQAIVSDLAYSDYSIVERQNQLPYRRAKGANSASYDSTDDLTTLWDRYRPTGVNRFNFGGLVFVDIHFCTHRLLRDVATFGASTLIRHWQTGALLRDD